jgi:hypothetical protein
VYTSYDFIFLTDAFKARKRWKSEDLSVSSSGKGDRETRETLWVRDTGELKRQRETEPERSAEMVRVRKRA